MPEDSSKKRVTTVREHPRHVPAGPKNPTGITIVDKHLRRLPGTFLDPLEIENIFKNYDRKNIVFPTSKKLSDYSNADKYDGQIAVWTDYFSKKFNSSPPLDPDVVKALIGSEAGFRLDPGENKKAFGIAQITKQTLVTIQDPTGEAKDFIFDKIRQKDLKNPDIAIPLAIRWLFRKKEMAVNALKRQPTDEEIILQYKGLLKSSTDYKNSALKRYREFYAYLKGQ